MSFHLTLLCIVLPRRTNCFTGKKSHGHPSFSHLWGDSHGGITREDQVKGKDENADTDWILWDRLSMVIPSNEVVLEDHARVATLNRVGLYHKNFSLSMFFYRNEKGNPTR
jgi:hypothetical protein